MRLTAILGVCVAILSAALSVPTAARSEGRTPITPDTLSRLAPAGMLGRGESRKVAWSNNGKRLAVGSAVGLWLYDVGNLKADPMFLADGMQEVNYIAFSPDDRFVAAMGCTARRYNGDSNSCFNIPLRIYDTTSGQTVVHQEYAGDFGLYYWPGTFRFDDRGLLVGLTPASMESISPNGKIDRVILPRSGKGELPGYAPPMVARSDKHIAVLEPSVNRASDKANIVIAQYGSVTPLHVLPLDNFRVALQFTPDGRTLIVVGSTYAAYEVESGKQLWSITNYSFDWRSLFSFSPDSKTAWMATHRGLATIDLSSGKLTEVDSKLLTDLPLEFEHERPVYSAANHKLAILDKQKTIRLFDVRTKTMITVLESGGTVQDLAFNPVSDVLAVASYRRAPTSKAIGVRLWNTDTWSQVNYLEIGDGNLIRYSRDGKWMAVREIYPSVKVHIIDLATSTTRLTFSTDGAGYQTAFLDISADGQYVAAAIDGRVKVWNLNALEAVVVPTTMKQIVNVAFSPVENTVALVGYSESDPQQGRGAFVELWSLDTLTMTRKISAGPNSFSYFALEYSPDGSTIAGLIAGYGNGGTVIDLWDTQSGTKITTVHQTHVSFDLAFSPDSRIIAIVGCDAVEIDIGCFEGPAMATFRDGRTGIEVGRITDGVYYASTVAFSPDGATLAIGSSEGVIRLYRIGESEGAFVTCPLCDAPSSTLYKQIQQVKSAKPSATPTLIPILSGTPRVDTIQGGHGEILLSQNGRRLVVVGTNNFLVYDTTDLNAEPLRLTADPTVWRPHISPDGSILAAPDEDYGDDKKAIGVQLWNVATGEALPTVMACNDDERRFILSVAISADSKKLAATCFRTIEIRDISTGRLITTIDTTKQPYSETIFFTQNDGLLVAGSRGFGFAVYDTETKQEVVGIRDTVGEDDVESSRISGLLYSIAIRYDGKVIGLFSVSQVAIVYELPTAVPIANVLGSVDEYSFCLNAEGTLSITRDADKVLFYELSARRVIHTFPLGNSMFRCVMNAEATVIVTQSVDDDIRVISLWDVVTGRSLGSVRVKLLPD